MGNSDQNKDKKDPQVGKVVLSLFDGMGCLYITLKELGIPIDKYYASELDVHAITQTKHNFPHIIHLGDVRGVDVSKLGRIDIVAGGSPCTDLSFAGKMSGLICSTYKDYMELRAEYLRTGNEDLYYSNGKFQQSILFWEYVRVLREVKKFNPDVIFFLENVRMRKDQERVINEELGIMPVRINSSLVSAQNRVRNYWTNIRTRREGLFGDLVTDIPQPEDRGIMLRDILQPEEEVAEKYYINNPKFKDWFETNDDFIKLDKELNKKANQEKAGCLTAGGHSGGNHSDMDIICVALRGRDRGDGWEHNNHVLACDYRADEGIRIKKSGKSGTLTARARNDESCGQMVIQINESKESNKKQPYQQNRVYDVRGIMPALSTDPRSPIIQINEATKQNINIIGNVYPSNGQAGKIVDINHKSVTVTGQRVNSQGFINTHKLRRLTPLECQRLQTVPEWYRWVVSDTQVYKMLGNGWTIEVIKHIFKYLIQWQK